MTAGLAAGVSLQIVLGGHARTIALTLPRAELLYPLIHDSAIRDARMAETDLATELMQIATIDGGELDRSTARALLAEPAALAQVLAERDRLYHAACEQGRARIPCPACGVELVLDLVGLMVLLSAPAWNLFDRGILPAAPRLAGELRRGARPAGVATARSMGFDLPWARVGLAGADDAVRGTFTAADAGEESAAWARWTPPDAPRDDHRTWWRPRHPGFRAVLRLAVALRGLERADGSTVDLDPAAVARLGAADVQFLDLLYSYAVVTDAGETAVVECAACAVRFVPVL